jgi:Fe-S-cluster containining protein
MKNQDQLHFNCTKCGACCKFVQASVMLLRSTTRVLTDPGEILLREFPYGFKNDGSCEKYDDKIGCTIYENRPSVCRVDDMEQIYREHYGWTKLQYYQELAKTCNYMITALHLDDRFIILPGKEFTNTNPKDVEQV